MRDRAALSTAFLAEAGWSAAQRLPLAGDASDRRYERLLRSHESAILMDAPPGLGDDPADFVRISRYLVGLGLSAPLILAEDLPNGFLLLEDFGDTLFARLLDEDPQQEAPLYRLAADVLIHLSRAPMPPGVPDLTAEDWAAAASLAVTDYAVPLVGALPTAPIVETLSQALRRHADTARVFIHRDFHAENLILLPGRAGLAQVGILDFQLGQAGQAGYDLVSLLQDARRDVSQSTEAAMVARYAAAMGLDPAAFAARYAVLGAQRALRILGIFARLARGGKPRYLPMVPRVWGQLQRNLAHPDLADLAAACALLPVPTATAMHRLVPA